MNHFHRQESTDSYSSDIPDMSHASITDSMQVLPQTGYPPFGCLFPDHKSAKECLYGRDLRGHSPGSHPFSHYRTNMLGYAQLVYGSIVNLDGLRERSSNSYKNFRDNKISNRAIEATSVMIVEAWIKRHERGPLRCFDKVPAVDRNLEMEERFESICYTLKLCKLNCEDVLKKGKLEYLVHAPEQARKTKEQNKAINNQREPVLKAGNEALGRKPKRPTHAANRARNRTLVAPRPNPPARDYHADDASFNFNTPRSDESMKLPPISSYASPLGQSALYSGSSSSSSLHRSSKPAPITTSANGSYHASGSAPKTEEQYQWRAAQSPQASWQMNTSSREIFTPNGNNFNPNFRIPTARSILSAQAGPAQSTAAESESNNMFDSEAMAHEYHH